MTKKCFESRDIQEMCRFMLSKTTSKQVTKVGEKQFA